MTLLALATLGALASAQNTITTAEREGLMFMREEEKLARDVYTVLANKWGEQPFGNIVRSEQSHMDAVKRLLDEFRIPDPAKDMKAGHFKNPTLQKLYTDLVKSGTVTREAAFRVGATIEDLDIYDLRRLQKEVNNAQILSVYAQLERGSRNHLRAFARNLSRTGLRYEPAYISPADYKQIIESPQEKGGRWGG